MLLQVYHLFLCLKIKYGRQDIDEKKICLDLNKCLLTEKELNTHKWEVGYDDKWPVEKMI